VRRTEHSRNETLYAMVRCRCPNCGGGTIDQCFTKCAEGAEDARRIDRMLEAGMTNDEILEWFVDERGDGALAIPSDKVLVWWIPILGVVGGLFLIGLAAWALRRGKDGLRTAGGPPAPSSVDRPENRGYRERLAIELMELD
jgi:cytochrome c-type biogenesis protein CcmH/NrfF